MLAAGPAGVCESPWSPGSAVFVVLAGDAAAGSEENALGVEASAM